MNISHSKGMATTYGSEDWSVSNIQLWDLLDMNLKNKTLEDCIVDWAWDKVSSKYLFIPIGQSLSVKVLRRYGNTLEVIFYSEPS